MIGSRDGCGHDREAGTVTALGPALGFFIGVICGLAVLLLIRTARASRATLKTTVAEISQLLAIPTFSFGGPWVTSTLCAGPILTRFSRATRSPCPSALQLSLASHCSRSSSLPAANGGEVVGSHDRRGHGLGTERWSCRRAFAARRDSGRPGRCHDDRCSAGDAGGHGCARVRGGLDLLWRVRGPGRVAVVQRWTPRWPRAGRARLPAGPAAPQPGQAARYGLSQDPGSRHTLPL